MNTSANIGSRQTAKLLTVSQRLTFGDALRKLSEEPFDLRTAEAISPLIDHLSEQNFQVELHLHGAGGNQSGLTDAGDLSFDTDPTDQLYSIGTDTRERIGHYRVWQHEKNIVAWEHFLSANVIVPPDIYLLRFVDGAPVAFARNVPRVVTIFGLDWWIGRQETVWRRAPLLGVPYYFRMGVQAYRD